MRPLLPLLLAAVLCAACATTVYDAGLPRDASTSASEPPPPLSTEPTASNPPVATKPPEPTPAPASPPRPELIPAVYGTPLTDFLVASALLNSIQPLEVLVHPFPTGDISSGWGEPRRGGAVHLAADVRELRGDMGVGKPIRAMTRGKITRLGRPQDDPKRYGRPDCRPGFVTRSGKRFPRVLEVEGYGTVCPFTSTEGTSGMGNIIEVDVIGGELDRHHIRYMHMGAIHPSLKMGDVIEPGQEIGLMGGTGVQKSSPHLHLDISTPEGLRVDPAPYLKTLQGRPNSHCAISNPPPDPLCALPHPDPTPSDDPL